MPKVWSRLSLLVLALFLQLGVARAARCASPVLTASLAVAVAEACVARWSPANGIPSGKAGGEEGTPSEDSNLFEQDAPLDDVSDTECALSAVLAVQQASEAPQRLHAGAGVCARQAALDAPFKPPRA